MDWLDCEGTQWQVRQFAAQRHRGCGCHGHAGVASQVVDEGREDLGGVVGGQAEEVVDLQRIRRTEEESEGCRRQAS